MNCHNGRITFSTLSKECEKGDRSSQDKNELDKSVSYSMGGLPSTVTNESIFRIPVYAKSSCHVPEKT